jgi:formate-dependent nitrite reductase membrane component NrfD
METHRFDTLSFISGLIFTGFGLLFLIPTNTDDLIDVFVDVGSWAWPLILLGIGLAIIVPVFLNREETTEAEMETEPVQVD